MRKAPGWHARPVGRSAPAGRGNGEAVGKGCEEEQEKRKEEELGPSDHKYG